MTFALPKEQAPLKPVRTPRRALQPAKTSAGKTPASAAALSAPLSSLLPASDPSFLAHDAHNWLTVLQVYCDLLRSSGVVGADPQSHQSYQRWIEELSKTVQRGHGLVESLLESAQTTVHRAPQERVPAVSATAIPLDVAEAVTRRLPLFQHLAGRTIQVEVDAAANAGRVAMSESTFDRILHNLVSNAIEAMPHGGQLQIAVQRAEQTECKPRRSRSATGTAIILETAKLEPLERRSDRRSKPAASRMLLLRISDTGSGIPSDRLAHIFEPGITSKSDPSNLSNQPNDQNKTRAHGLGLAIVRLLIERAGGSIRVRSRAGEGSCFEIELPRVAGAATTLENCDALSERNTVKC